MEWHPSYRDISLQLVVLGCGQCKEASGQRFAGCRVPLRKRGAQQRITPDVQTGCISCATGDSKSGAPIWWNTPIDEEGKDEDNVATWNQVPPPHLHRLQLSIQVI